LADLSGKCADWKRPILRRPRQFDKARGLSGIVGRLCRNDFRWRPLVISREAILRKLIAFDDDTFDKLRQLSRDRMGTIQELADEAFADLLKKHGIPIDLKAALRKSASLESASVGDRTVKNGIKARKKKS
jgi:hypothetical protein